MRRDKSTFPPASKLQCRACIIISSAQLILQRRYNLTGLQKAVSKVIMSNSTIGDTPGNKGKTFLTVGIGASAGGITPLKEFFAAMPADSGMAFVVILHLSPEYESQLDNILQAETTMPVIQVHETLTVEPNHVYVIPPSKHLALVDGLIRLIEPEKTRGKRVPIDIFFRTLAEAYGKNGIAIVLSGTGSDGTLGLKRVKEAGGICIAQDPEQAEYGDMPNHAISTKLVDLILPVSEMPRKLLEIKQGVERLVPNADFPEIATEKAAGLETDALQDVLSLLKAQTGHDFTDYKRPTMLRRVTRRLQVHGLDDIPPYVEFLKNNPDEVQFLLRDLLISVTNFFRDKEAFAALEKQVIPQLFRDKSERDQVRVWCVACATGEEAYSVAMLLLEYTSKLVNPPRIQIFATDIEETSLAAARAGRYDETIALDVSPQRLRRFFIKEDHYYVVKEEVRELVLFAPHNILRDPPFSRQDLVLCRNLLIYLNRTTQEKIFEIFYFALRTNGFLFVGASESAESSPSLFSSIDKKQRIYQARPTVVKYNGVPPVPILGHRFGKAIQPETNKSELSSSFADLHCKIIERFAAPSVLIDENYDILHSGEKATSFLQFVSGEPTRNLTKTVLPSLKQDLLAALFTAREEHKPTEARNIRIQTGGDERFINLCVKPIEFPEVAKGFFLVTFEEIKEEDIPAEILKTVLGSSDEVSTTVITRLEEELHLTKNRLRLTIEEQDTMVEELKASNEELQAMNEELRLATEELETGREELQSVNEEMITVNNELKEKIDEVSRVNSDLRNLIASTDIGTIFLDRALQLQLYTPPIQEIFNVIASDIGRPLEHITHKLDYDNFIEDASEVLRNLHSVEREVHSENNRWYLVRLMPYRTMDDHIDGVVITFVDFTKRKYDEEELARITKENEQQARFFDMALSNINDFTYMFDREGRFLYSNKALADLLGLKPADMVGKNFFDLNYPPQTAAKLQNEIEQVFQTKTVVKSETEYTNPAGVTGFYEYIFTPVITDNEVEFVAGSTRDITNRKEREKTLTEEDHRKDIFLATLAHELRNPLAPIHSGLELIRRSKGDPQITQRTLEVIERQTNRIIHLVDDLLEVSRITQGKITLHKERFELKNVIGSTMEAAHGAIDSNEHQFTLSLPDEPIYLDADLIRVEQILLNLLTNAARYTPPKGKIELSAEKHADEVIIRVHDNGLGISPEAIPNVFDMFNQVDTSSKQGSNGLGIGLSVVKQLVELHGGSVSASSEGLGKGSEFTVHLPLAKPRAEEDKKEERETAVIAQAKPAKKKVLIVDDNADVAEMLKAILSLDGHEVRAAFNAESGIEAAKGFRPDVCLCDIGLPGMSGYQMARHLRAILPGARLVAFTGWGQEADLLKSKEAGFDDHLVKGANMVELAKSIFAN